MKRPFLVVLVLLAAVLLSVERAEAESYFVFIEKTGLDLYCGMYSSLAEVMARARLVKVENENRSANNDSVNKELKKLRGQVAAK